MNMNRIRAALGIVGLAALYFVSSTSDEAAYQAERISKARAEMAGRGVCGTGGTLALLSDGYACMHVKPDGRVIARPVFDDPIQLAAASGRE